MGEGVMMDFVKDEKTFESKVALAKLRVEAMDSIDGFPDRAMGTIIQALVTGLRDPVRNGFCAFDALFMLADLAKREDLIS